jgi:hypothetical protein
MEETLKHPPHFRAGFEDLTNEERSSCDHFLVLLSKHNRTAIEATDEYRKIFWNKVFDRWNTNRPIIKPRLAKRTDGGTTIPVGKLKADCPVPAQGTKRMRDGTYVLPAARQRGAQVLYKLNVNTDAPGLTFKHTDSGNSIVPANLVDLREGYTPSLIQSMLVQHWDEHEWERVSVFNERLVVFWARQQLVAKLEHDRSSAAEIQPPVRQVDQDQDVSELVMVTSAYDSLKIMEEAAENVRRATNGNPYPRYIFKN